MENEPKIPAETLSVDTIQIEELTPQTSMFADTYPEAEIASDDAAANLLENTFGEHDDARLSDVMEVAFIRSMRDESWTEEQYILNQNSPANRPNEDGKASAFPSYVPISVIPTNRIDDWFNHIDVIGAIRNSDTLRPPSPSTPESVDSTKEEASGAQPNRTSDAADYGLFGIDITYNTNPDQLSEKFGHVHQLGLIFDNNVDNISEFGYESDAVDTSGNQATQLVWHQSKLRYGLKMPGFATAKYYKDLSDPDIDLKGRIGIMPRFIIGYSPELVKTIAEGKPKEPEYPEMATDVDSALAQADIAKYQEDKLEWEDQNQRFLLAQETMKYCTLLEIQEQLSLLEQSLQRIENVTYDINGTTHAINELRYYYAAKKQVKKLKRYFGKALAFSIGLAETSDLSKQAYQNALDDPVRRILQDQAKRTYLDGEYSEKGTDQDIVYEAIHNQLRTNGQSNSATWDFDRQELPNYS